MKLTVIVMTAALFCLLTGADSAAAQVDSTKAAAYFDEVEEQCGGERGMLWGISLCGPMVIADAVSGTIATNQPVPEAPRPRVLGYANAALEWGDERWSAFVWQIIPEDPDLRMRLFMHELFHRIQPELGLYISTADAMPDHLDTPEGRYWMQLEWRALSKALESTGPAGIRAVGDALAFRLKRHSLFPGSANRERILEINEGLAQYTGTAAASPNAREAERDAIGQLREAPEKESFVRTFAYPSGAAYGLLLDREAVDWKRHITADDDLADLLARALQIDPTADAEAAAGRYGGPELLSAEQQRESNRLARIAELHELFVDGPVLVMPRGRNASFLTAGVTPIPGEGTVYPSFRVTGEWGSIVAEQVLMSPDGQTLTVPAPEFISPDSLSGKGWSVTLDPEWTVRRGTRTGDMEIVRKSTIKDR